MSYAGKAGRVGIGTGANHGIGAATAQALAMATYGLRVLVSYLQLEDQVDSGMPDSYRANRARDAGWRIQAIGQAGGQAESVQADLRDPGTPAALFDAAERAFGRSRSWSTTPGAPTPSDPRSPRTGLAAGSRRYQRPGP